MVTRLGGKLTTNSLTDLIGHTTLFRDKKRETEERISSAKANASNVQANQRANKKKSAKIKKVGLSSLRAIALCRVLFRRACPWYETLCLTHAKAGFLSPITLTSVSGH